MEVLEPVKATGQISIPSGQPVSGNLSGRSSHTALVTGAAGAIGQAIAHALATQGTRVVLHDLDLDSVRRVAQRLPGAYASHLATSSDLLDLKNTRDQIGRALQEVEGADILINCAGIAADRRPIEELTDEYVRLQLDINVCASIALAQLVIAHMKRSRWGRIINISSTNGTVGFANASAYNAAKGALISLAKGWAKEFGVYGITANVVAPGLIETPMTLSYGPDVLRAKAKSAVLERAGTPAEVAAVVAFLASEAAGYVTGQVISPNGGSAIT